MRITIQICDGRRYAFTISDGAQFVQRLRFWEIFERPILRIHDGKDTWAFSPALIEKIQFSDEEPPWRPPDNILSFKSISNETHKRKLARLDAGAPPTEKDFEAGKCREALFDVTLASGAVEHFEAMIMLRPRHEQMINLYRLFEKVAYPIPREEGGFVLVNASLISCIRIHPAPPEDPETGWVVDEFAGSERTETQGGSDVKSHAQIAHPGQ